MKLNKILFMWTVSIISVLCWSCQTLQLPPLEDNSIRGFSFYLQRIIPRLINDRIPGVQIAVIEKGHITSLMAFGLKDKVNHLPVDNETEFQAASISKTITAWAVLKLVEEQKIDLDAPVWQYVHRWKPEKSRYDPERITVRSLLSHRSGLTLTGFPGYAPGERIPSLEESLSGNNGAFYGIVHMGPARLECAPWSKYSYSGGGYSVLQLMIEEVTRMDFATYVQQAIMNPLEMRHSSFELNDAIQTNLSKAYSCWGRERPNYVFVEKAAAGLYTTAHDLAVVLNELYRIKNDTMYESTILSRETAKLFYSTNPYVKDGEDVFGYFRIKQNGTIVAICHKGSNQGWRTYCGMQLDSGKGIVMLTNSDAGNDLILKVIGSFYENVLGMKI